MKLNVEPPYPFLNIEKILQEDPLWPTGQRCYKTQR
jgi:hypothetical protein